MYQKILVPLDGSPRAEAILPHVEQLALQFGSMVIFLQVVERVMAAFMTSDPQTADFIRLAEETQEHEASGYLEGRCREFREKNIAAETRIEHGPVVATIVEVAQKEHADLIAMASHGRTGLSHVFYGSVAAGVLHRADRPLLVVRS